jgi:hypothetical protein
MGSTITQNVKTARVMNAQASAATNVNSSVVDSANFDNIRFEALLGAINTGGAVNVKVQGGALADGSDMADLIGVAVALTDADDNKIAILEVITPRERYLRCVVERTTQPSVIDGVVALLGGASHKPTVDDSTVKSRILSCAPSDGS